MLIIWILFYFNIKMDVNMLILCFHTKNQQHIMIVET